MPRRPARPSPPSTEGNIAIAVKRTEPAESIGRLTSRSTAASSSTGTLSLGQLSLKTVLRKASHSATVLSPIFPAGLSLEIGRQIEREK